MWTGKADQVYQQLRASIESGEFEPGQALPEIALVEKTGFSRTPVREALRQLNADGLVDIEPRRAPTVSKISIQGTRELFAFRRIIETAAISLIASSVAQRPEVKTEFSSLASKFKELVSSEGKPQYVTDFFALAAQFDELVLALTPNQYIVTSINALKPHLTRVRRISKTDHSRLPQSVQEHIAICKAISDGNSAKAIEVMTTHLIHVEEAVFKQLVGNETRVPIGLT